MAEFIDNLGKDATVGDVFAGVYTQVDDLINTLDALRIEEHGVGTSIKYITGLAVGLNWSWHRHGGFGEPLTDDSTFTTHVELPLRHGASRFLLSRSVDKISGVDYPSGVTAKRGEELGADYRVRREVDTNEVTVRLGKEGFWRTRKQPEANEPIGESILESRDKVNQLTGVDRHRLSVVAHKIADTVTATEMIIDGADPKSVLEANGMLEGDLGY